MVLITLLGSRLAYYPHDDLQYSETFLTKFSGILLTTTLLLVFQTKTFNIQMPFLKTIQTLLIYGIT